MAIGPVLVIVLLLLLVGALPMWPHSRDWSLRPMSAVATLLVVLVLLRWAIKF